MNNIEYPVFLSFLFTIFIFIFILKQALSLLREF